jgi:hypothetical protein
MARTPYHYFPDGTDRRKRRAAVRHWEEIGLVLEPEAADDPDAWAAAGGARGTGGAGAARERQEAAAFQTAGQRAAEVLCSALHSAHGSSVAVLDCQIEEARTEMMEGT